MYGILVFKDTLGDTYPILADVKENYQNILRAHGIEEKAVEEKREAKKNKNGGFAKRLF